MFTKLSQLIHPHIMVGTSFTDETIRMVLVKGSGGNPALFREEEMVLEPGVIENGKIKNVTVFQDHLKQMTRSLKAKGRTVCFSVPTSQLIIRLFELPGLMSDADLQNYFFIEIGKKIQLPFERPVFDFHVIERDANTTRVTLFAAPEKLVCDYRDALRSSGLKPVGAEFNGLGIDRWARRSEQRIGRKHRMYVQMENGICSVVIFKDELPLFVRQVNLKNMYASDGSKESLYINAATEIDRMLNFYQYSIQKSEDNVSHIYLVGSLQEANAFAEVLSRHLPIPAEPLHVDSEKTDAGINPKPEFIPALGLALKGAEA